MKHEVVVVPHVADAECQAKENTIRAECILAAPVAVHKQEFQRKIDEHQGRYPGGTLPSELRDFADYMGRLSSSLESAEREKMRCLSCGHYPWT